MNQELTAQSQLDIVRQHMREFITASFLFDGDAYPLRDDTSLVAEGIVDPTGVLEVVLFIEETYGVDVSEADLTPENFDSINTLAAYVVRRLTDE